MWGLLVWMACSPPPSDMVEAPPRFGFTFPVDDPSRISRLIGVDHDPVVQTERVEQLVCWDYLQRGFPHCYDEHDGSDYVLDGGFEAMDAGSPAVVAAADGVVVAVSDGHYDRCHGTLDGVDCDGEDGIANAVTLAHEDGSRTLYWHLMRDSVLVAVDDVVLRSEPLGRVGSSGNSSFPHLHFEVQSAEGEVVDPYAGPASQPDSRWCDQRGADELPASAVTLGGPCPT